MKVLENIEMIVNKLGYTMREFINEDKDKFFQLKAEVKDQDGYTVSSRHVFSIMEREEYKKITSESAGLKQMLLLFLSSFYFAGL